MGEIVQKIQAFSLSIAFMDKSRGGAVREERNQSVFDSVYTVILTIHSTFRKAVRVLYFPSTCDVTPTPSLPHSPPRRPPSPYWNFTGFFLSLRGKSVPFHSASSQRCFPGRYRLFPRKQDGSGSSAGSPNKNTRASKPTQSCISPQGIKTTSLSKMFHHM